MPEQNFVYVIVDQEGHYVGKHSKFTGICNGFMFFNTRSSVINEIMSREEEGLDYKYLDIHKIPKGKPVICQEHSFN